jgi:ABC-type transport system involved in cytochrome bd biosynthesis fused ATPase/permease subunit
MRPLGALALVPLISFGSSAVLNGFRVLGIGIIATGAYIGHLCLPDQNEWVMYTAIGFIAVLFVTKIAPEIQKDISKELENLNQ